MCKYNCKCYIKTNDYLKPNLDTLKFKDTNKAKSESNTHKLDDNILKQIIDFMDDQVKTDISYADATFSHRLTEFVSNINYDDQSFLDEWMEIGIDYLKTWVSNAKVEDDSYSDFEENKECNIDNSLLKCNF